MMIVTIKWHRERRRVFLPAREMRNAKCDKPAVAKAAKPAAAKPAAVAAKAAKPAAEKDMGGELRGGKESSEAAQANTDYTSARCVTKVTKEGAKTAAPPFGTKPVRALAGDARRHPPRHARRHQPPHSHAR
jgi:hypothetical protein